MRIISISIILVLLVNSDLYAGDSLSSPTIPTLTSSDSNNAHKMYNKARSLRTKNKVNQTVGEYNGYEVKDSEGNVFYVDDIEDPENCLYIINIEDNSGVGASSSYDINSEVEIDTIIFK